MFQHCLHCRCSLLVFAGSNFAVSYYAVVIYLLPFWNLNFVGGGGYHASGTNPRKIIAINGVPVPRTQLLKDSVAVLVQHLKSQPRIIPQWHRRDNKSAELMQLRSQCFRILLPC